MEEKNKTHTIFERRRLVQKVANSCIETGYFGIINGHVEVRVLVEKLFEYMKNGRRNFLKKRMRDKARDITIEEDGRIDEFSNSGLDDGS